MSADIEFWIGTTWTVFGTAQKRNEDGTFSILDLTDGSVEFRVGTPEAELFKSVSGDGLLSIPPDTAAAGNWQLVVQPGAGQTIPPGVYTYEVISIDSAGGIEPQNVGSCIVRSTIKSLFG